jgi:uncharacterized protein (DUF488 family)
MARVTKLNRLYTIGHSTRTIEQFLSLLKVHEIEQLIDIRTIPKSRHNPQFNKDVLAKSVRDSGIDYRYMGKLGGLRHTKADSPNLGWNNLSFRGFADYMGTNEFMQAIDELRGFAEKKKTAIMCAEAVPWRCHRSLISDVLTQQGWEVLHITSQKTASVHKLTPFLRVREGRIIYPKI